MHKHIAIDIKNASNSTIISNPNIDIITGIIVMINKDYKFILYF